jgi:hypothetical protein
LSISGEAGFPSPEGTNSLAALQTRAHPLSATEKLTSMGQQANLLPNSELAVGWISRNTTLAFGRGGVFFDIRFIELIDHFPNRSAVIIG